MNFFEFLRSRGIEASDARLAHFTDWALTSLWAQYKQSRMDLAILAANSLRAANVRVPNGTKGTPFPDNTIALPAEPCRDYQFAGLEGIGLDVEKIDETTFRIVGTPTAPGDYTITISYDYEGRLEEEPRGEHTFHLIVNPDPRSLWKDIPTSKDIIYYKPDTDSDYVKRPGKDIVGASRRGRSHANEGKPRDDDFVISYLEETGWYIMAVCDGAGSAKCSRKGAQLACQTVLNVCSRELENPDELENAVKACAATAEESEERKQAARAVYDRIYTILGNAALQAHKDITTVARENGFAVRDFSTTLLLTVCKKFDFGWFVASYWVGDGAIGIFDSQGGTVRIMGTPDEGEFSGQTRFLTMPEIFRSPQDVYSRLRFAIVPDFTAVMLMSDGVSDPMFETDTRLNDAAEWQKLWDRLRDGFPEDGIRGVDLRDNDPKCAEELLAWLDFWSKGNHDDRTLVILY